MIKKALICFALIPTFTAARQQSIKQRVAALEQRIATLEETIDALKTACPAACPCGATCPCTPCRCTVSAQQVSPSLSCTCSPCVCQERCEC